jgi:hypothetical protein
MIGRAAVMADRAVVMVGLTALIVSSFPLKNKKAILITRT